jgi:WD40 repeat protein
VILYELLAGRLPYALEQLPLPELARVIREQEPSRLGSIDVRLRGDVETIVARALEKDRARRYPSAAELAADVRRHLKGEPIRARRVGAAERAWAWARRRPTLAAAYALAALAVVLGLGGGLAVWSWRTAEGLRRAAEDARTDAVRARQAEAAANEKLDQVLYLHRVQLAHREWLNKDLGRSRQLLAECPPQRRHWEWRYVSRLNPLLLEVAEPLGSIPDLRISPGSVQFSLDGRLISMAEVGRSRVRDSETGEEVATLEGSAPASPDPGRPPSQVALSPDGKVIAATWGQAVRIWDAGTGKLLRTLSRPEGPEVSCIAFSHDGRRLALGAGSSHRITLPPGNPNSRDHRLRVWDAETGREVLSLPGHQGKVSAVAFSADGRWLASGSEDHTVKLWEAATGRELRTLQGHTGQVGSVAFAPEPTDVPARPGGGRLASAGADGKVKVWDPASGKLLLTLAGRGGRVYAVAFRPDGKLLAAGLDNGVVLVWDVATGQEAFSLRKDLANHLPVTGLSFSPDGTRLASFVGDGTVKVWDATAAPEVRTIPLPLHETTALALGGDGRRLVEGRETGEVLVWEVSAGGSRGPPGARLGHQGPVAAAAISPDGRRAATVGMDRTLRLWDAGAGKQLAQWQAHEGLGGATRFSIPKSVDAGDVKAHKPLALAVVFSPDGRLVATAGGPDHRGEVKLWDAGGRLLLDVRDHPGSVASVAFSPDGRWLVSGDILGTVKTRNAQTGEVLWERKVSGRCDRVTFSPDGGKVAASDPSRSRIHVWDAATGEEVQELTGGDTYLSIQFSPDGRRLVSSSQEGTIILWDVATGQEALRLKGGYREVWFSADGSRLFSAGWQPTPAVKVWEAGPLSP